MTINLMLGLYLSILAFLGFSGVLADASPAENITYGLQAVLFSLPAYVAIATLANQRLLERRWYLTLNVPGWGVWLSGGLWLFWKAKFEDGALLVLLLVVNILPVVTMGMQKKSGRG